MSRKHALMGGAAAAVLVAAALVLPTMAEAGTTDPGAPGAYPVGVLDYSLGDTAYKVAGFRQDDLKGPAPLELTGDVHYPAKGRGPFPMVVLSHGYWGTCADRAASDLATQIQKDKPDSYYDDPQWLAATKRLWQWPCPSGIEPLPSFRGYDYLAERLASHGMVVISISANGVNAGQLGEPADNARSMLINKHLALWSELVRTGRGPLAGKLTDPRTHRPVQVDFTGKVDFQRTGTMGHSRGGRGVAWNAADVHRKDLPAGVKLAGVFALAAAGAGTATNPGSPDAKLYRVTSAPLAVWVGGCDDDQGLDYVTLAQGHTRKPIYEWRARGANHNFLNTQWSPQSGQVGAVDDQGVGPEPGYCGTPTYPDWDPESGTPEPPPTWSDVTRKLTEEQERQVLTGYATAFFRATLLGDKSQEPVISGKTSPYASFTRVDATRI